MPSRAGTRMLEGRADPGFDVDAFHVMEARDNALIQDEVLHGAMSRKFVYQFKIKDTTVTGISVIGARQLAFHYRGLKHRIVASQEKTGVVFKFTSYPQPGMPMSVQASVLPELEDQPDFYSAIVEVQDIKTGNAVQMESSETRQESRRDGSLFERPHYQKIAQAKAYRNAVLALIPQDVQLQWKTQMLELGEGVVITEDVIEEKRSGVLRYAAQHAIPVNRATLQAIGFDQISGLSDAARTGLPAFRAALGALGMADPGEPPPDRTTPPRPPRTPQTDRPPAGHPAGQDGAGGSGPPNPPAQTEKPPEPPPAGQGSMFRAELRDHNDHIIRTFDDPMQYAHALLEMRDLCFPPDVEAFDANNAAGVLDAARASVPATNLLSALLPRPATEPVPLSSNLAVYGKAVQDAIAALAPDDVAAFCEANARNWMTLPRSRQLELERLVIARCETLGVPPPALFGQQA